MNRHAQDHAQRAREGESEPGRHRWNRVREPEKFFEDRIDQWRREYDSRRDAACELPRLQGRDRIRHDQAQHDYSQVERGQDTQPDQHPAQNVRRLWWRRHVERIPPASQQIRKQGSGDHRLEGEREQ